jgi:subtilase family serine protease
MLLKILTLAVTAGAAAGHVERAPALSHGWREVAAPSVLASGAGANNDVTFALHVKERNLDRVKEIALSVSTPGSAFYGEYLDADSLAALTAPDEAHVAAVRAWANAASGSNVKEIQGRRFEITLPQTDAETLLKTTFRSLINTYTGQRTLVAGDYTVPDAVKDATAAVFGLHGLPLPPRASRTADQPMQPAKVTPAVITSQYAISAPVASKSSGNKQAVAEFQGQTMSSKDLKQFFSQYVPNAPAGADTVSKFVGSPGDGMGQTEASLDIQYIMGVAPGIDTEFWYYKSSDFCADLKNWTSMLIAAGSDAPLVTSVSYGWQGNLTKIGCTDDNVNAVDADFAKLAASGITIIFASGDSGSGYTNQPSCTPKSDTELQGTIKSVVPAQDSFECCFRGQEDAGWMYDGPSGPPQPPKCHGTGTADTALQGDALISQLFPDEDICCEISSMNGVGYTFTKNSTQHLGNCTIFKSVTGKIKQKGSTSGQNPKRQEGNCTTFSKVTGTKRTTGKTSGTNGGGGPVQLWPSWPASSPWVTSVGATRFVGQKAGNAEMATDQFGSGGGFSAQFDQTHAKWQSAAVKEYLKIVPKGKPFPPKSSFSATGRGTPDVAALGEGFQVLQAGHVMPVGGTSASAPTFAAVVSLLNEHQLQKGGKPLGFLNPWLFANPDMFTDVTQGTNAIGRGTGPIPYGYNCTKAWDPATGLGTPKFDAMVKALP